MTQLHSWIWTIKEKQRKLNYWINIALGAGAASLMKSCECHMPERGWELGRQSLLLLQHRLPEIAKHSCLLTKTGFKMQSRVLKNISAERETTLRSDFFDHFRQRDANFIFLSFFDDVMSTSEQPLPKCVVTSQICHCGLQHTKGMLSHLSTQLLCFLNSEFKIYKIRKKK